MRYVIMSVTDAQNEQFQTWLTSQGFEFQSLIAVNNGTKNSCYKIRLRKPVIQFATLVEQAKNLGRDVLLTLNYKNKAETVSVKDLTRIDSGTFHRVPKAAAETKESYTLDPVTKAYYLAA